MSSTQVRTLKHCSGHCGDLIFGQSGQFWTYLDTFEVRTITG
jgi:hypothetical protein